ncbi:hypothetical protein LAC81_14955 [Ensifer adhaerens]|uniref:hypothetical protein n=1 Tax=Ensifer adhaerens TaxID=106592 RepID=UPI001CBDB8B3|nr:hypothetical protein [Ensifer adhaerens]MBZ7923088.1 hypothetical protein [Ensifer adhaerens]UAX91679.1 hypothetical protein LAC78_14950 [Ensifer adhaerens]UAX99307.1 hypothetical protein LAC80_14955 [Ensifer adhaerens]UAY06690.1 hypothetical protein LAC81_14955 [Ensifer adhaerens]
MLLEWTRPGTFIGSRLRQKTDMEHRQDREAQQHFRRIEESLIDANICMNFYKEAERNSWGSEAEADQPAASNEFDAEHGPVASHTQAGSERYAEVLAASTRRRWDEGQLPDSHKNRLVHIYAQAFISAIDMFGRLLEQTIPPDGKEQALSEIVDEFRSNHPHVRGVRNTIQHMDERYKGLKRERGRLSPINLQEGMLMLSMPTSETYGGTMDNGAYGQVEISFYTLLSMRDALIKLYDLYEWDLQPHPMPD